MWANMRSIDRSMVMAARGLGASPFAAFWRVFLPLSLPGIVAGTVLVVVLSVGFYVTPAILGGGRIVMIAEYIGFAIQETLRWGMGTMLASTLLFGIFGLLALSGRVIDIKGLFGAK
jgi:putative spermidine/putrescine transport system permease protein